MRINSAAIAGQESPSPKSGRECVFMRCAGNLRRRILFVLLLVIALPGLFVSAAAETREKKIFAHHMGSLNAGTGAMRWWTENIYRELGDPTTSNGGPYRNFPLAPYGKDIGNLAAADLDIRRAMRIGIDGFAINAWAGGDQNRAYMAALFQVAEENDYPFEITICLDPATLGADAGLSDPDGNPYPSDGAYGPGYQRAVNAIQYLLDHYGESPKLARRDGKPLIFGYMSSYTGIHYARKKFLDKTENEIRSNAWGWEAIGEGIRELENQVNEPLYLHFCMQALFHGVWNLQKTKYADAAVAIAKHVDAVGEFLPTWIEHEGATPHNELRSAAERVGALGKEWSHPVMFQYENTKNNKTIPVNGTNVFSQSWSEARKYSTLVQYTTWNDYHEASNLAPGYDTRYAAFDLAAYYIDWWKTDVRPTFEVDKVYIFSRKYPAGATVFPFQDQKFSDGAIDIVTILTEPAVIHLPNRGTYEAPAGYFSMKLPVTPGLVAAEVWRNGKRELRLDHPELVSERPFRQDNGITSISSEFMRHWVADFGEVEPPLFYSEYGDADGDGLPNWFEMYWFGKFLDLSTATVADPGEDANGSGRTNFEEYLAQRDPKAIETETAALTKTTAIASSSSGNYAGMPFHGEPAKIPGRVQAQDFDKGGNRVAYFETIWANQGKHYRTGESVDIARVAWPHDPEGGEYCISHTRSGEWLNYSIDVMEKGYYDIHIRARAFWNGVALSVLFDGKNLTGKRVLETGVGANWTTTVIPQVPLEAGVQIMQVRMKGNGINAGIDLNYIEVIPSQLDRLPDIGIDLPVASDLYVEGNKIAIRADPPSYNIGRMYFKVNGEIIGETSGPDWSIQWEIGEPGECKIAVEAIGFPGGYHHSNEFTITVAEAQAGVVDPPAIRAWKESFFSDQELVSGVKTSLTADPDGDGIPNLLEYALGGNPTLAGSIALPVPQIERVGGEIYLTLSFNRPHKVTEVAYEVQTSTDLATWTTAKPDVYEVLPRGNWETVTVKTLISTDTTAALFKRLKVSVKNAL